MAGMSNRSSSERKATRGAATVLVVLLGVLVVAGVGGVLLFGRSQAHAGVGVTQAMGPMAELPAMEFTLADERRLHTVNLKVMLEFPPGTDAEVLREAVPRLTQAVGSRMIESQPGDLSGAAGTRFVKQQVSIATNREMRPLRVRAVMLQHFLVR